MKRRTPAVALIILAAVVFACGCTGTQTTSATQRAMNLRFIDEHEDWCWLTRIFLVSGRIVAWL